MMEAFPDKPKACTGGPMIGYAAAPTSPRARSMMGLMRYVDSRAHWRVKEKPRSGGA